LRRAHLAVPVVAALILTGCSVEQRPLRRGFATDETSTTSAGAPSTTRSAPATSSSAVPTARPRTAAEFAALALPQQALTEDGLDTRDPAGIAPSVAESQCGRQVSAPGRAADGYRVATRSASGASKFEQRVAAYPAGRAKDLVAAARELLPCGAGELALQAPSAVDGAVGWCEELAGGRGACGAVLTNDDTAVSLRMETISVERAREVLTRLAGSAAELLAKA
jgi:hypothetical protein